MFKISTSLSSRLPLQASTYLIQSSIRASPLTKPLLLSTKILHLNSQFFPRGKSAAANYSTGRSNHGHPAHLLQEERRTTLSKYPQLKDPLTLQALFREIPESQKAFRTKLAAFRAGEGNDPKYKEVKQFLESELKMIAVEAIMDGTGDKMAYEDRLKRKQHCLETLQKLRKERRGWWGRLLGINLLLNIAINLSPF